MAGEGKATAAQWPGPWISAVVAALGGSSVAAGLAWTAGWIAHSRHAELLGVPPELFSATDYTYDAVMLLPRCLICPAGALVHRWAWCGVLMPASFLAIVVWWFRRRAIARLGTRSPRNRVERLLMGAAIPITMLVLFVRLIPGKEQPLLTVTDILAAEAPQRLKSLKQNVGGTFVTFLDLPLARALAVVDGTHGLRSEDDHRAACVQMFVLLVGPYVWALAALSLWAYTLWRRLGVDWWSRSSGRRGGRVLLRILAIIIVGTSIRILLQVQGTLLPRNEFPKVIERVSDADVPTHSEAASTAAPWTGRPKCRCLAYLGTDGDFFYLYDCDEGRLEMRPKIQENWQLAGKINVVEAAWRTAGGAATPPDEGP